MDVRMYGSDTTRYIKQSQHYTVPMFGSKKPEKPAVPKVDEKAKLIAKLDKKATDLEGRADSLETEARNLQIHLNANDRDVSYESSQRTNLYMKAENNDNASKGRNKALNDTMVAEYARKEKPTPSQKQKIEDIRKKAKEQGI